MPRTPDPSYWGNPPQTPTAASRAQRQATPHQPASQPYAAPQPQQAWQQPYAQPKQANAPETGQAQQPYATPQPQANPYAQPQADPHAQPQPQTTPQQPNATPAKQPKPRRRSIAFVAIAVVAALAVIVCIVLLLRGAVQSGIEQITGSDASSPTGIVDDGSAFDTTVDPDVAMMNGTVRSYYGLSGSDPITRDELDAIQHDYFHDTEHASDLMPAGVYVVGETINAGTYWFEGEDDELSSFYLLQPTDDGHAYNVELLNDYYGHNLMELKSGEVLILDNNEGMRSIDPIAPLEDGFEAPYSSGVYRVGVDVPAGTYRLSVGSGADDFSAVYVMADLEYGDDSYLYEAQYVEGDTPEEIVLEEGTYIELYNMTMSPIKA